MRAVIFVNWTDSEFMWTWEREEYAFPAHCEIMIQDFLAEHFAKHLVDRELIKMGKQPNDQLRPDLLRKCFKLTDVAAGSKQKIEMDIMNAPKEVPISSELQPPKPRFCDTCDSKGIKHKKECPKYEAPVQKGSGTAPTATT